MAVVAEDGEVRLWKKQEQEQPLSSSSSEEEEEVNPLDARFSEYDPKQGEFIYTRYFFGLNFDLDMESPVGPMHHTDKIFKDGFLLCNSLNVVSVKIVSSDYGYPLNVYGTIIGGLHKPLKKNTPGIYLLTIDLQEDSLILTGPKRGFMVCDAIFFEINLKVVKDAHGRKVKDERLSKGLLEVDGIQRLSFEPKYEVETETLNSMHSTLNLSYTFVREAVEGTVEISILQGPVDFHGKIMASTSSTPCDIVLHDSKVSGVLTAGDNGVVQTARRVGVSVDEMLLLTVAAAEGGYEFSAGTVVEFTPRRNGYDEKRIMCGNHQMQVKFTWSIVYF